MNLTIDLHLPKTISLNALYAGKHWTFRKKTKDEYKKIVEKELANYDHNTYRYMSIHIRYNSRLDVDNNVANRWILDDSTKYYKSLRIVFDETVEKNYCEVKIDLKELMD